MVTKRGAKEVIRIEHGFTLQHMLRELMFQIVVGIIALCFLIAGLFLLLRGLRRLRADRNEKKPASATAILYIVFGVLVLLPLSYWIVQYVLFSVIFNGTHYLFNSWS